MKHKIEAFGLSRHFKVGVNKFPMRPEWGLSDSQQLYEVDLGWLWLDWWVSK